MISREVLRFMNSIEILGLCPVIILSLLISVIWDIYFAKRILYFVRIYRECMIKAKTDPFGNFAEAARNYKVEIVTHVFLLIMNITEFTTIGVYLGGSNANLLIFHSNHTDLKNATIHDCKEELQLRMLDFEILIANPFFLILYTIAQVSLLFSIALGICLVKYLHISYHELNINPFKIIKRFLLITSLIGIFLIISGSILKLMIMNWLVEPIILFTYFCIWVKSNRTFYKTLQWRTMEYRIRGRSNCIVRRSVISCHQFLIINSCFGVILACTILIQFLTQYSLLIAIAFFDGPCLFQYLYGTSYHKPLLNTQNQISSLELAREYFAFILLFLILTISVLLAVEYVLVSAFICGAISS